VNSRGISCLLLHLLKHAVSKKYSPFLALNYPSESGAFIWLLELLVLGLSEPHPSVSVCVARIHTE
jgi:hypothetical protein